MKRYIALLCMLMTACATRGEVRALRLELAKLQADTLRKSEVRYELFDRFQPPRTIPIAFNPSPQAWTSGFEADPLNTDSISQADDHLRQVKTETRDRGEVEHAWGSGMGNVTTDTGRLLEGAARVFVQNSAPTANGTISASCIAENDVAGNRGCDEGRVWVDRDGLDGVFGGGGAADDWQVNVCKDEDADGDCDSWQAVTATVAGGVGGTVPTNGIILWDNTSSCPAGYSEVTAFRNVTLRGADIAAADAAIPNSPGVGCNGSSAPAGCGAPGGTDNYDDDVDTDEIEAHTHTASQGTHAHTGGAHTHPLNLPADDSDTGNDTTRVRLGNATAPGNTTFTGTTDSGGAVATSTVSAGPITIGNAGGGENHYHPFYTVLLCRKT